MSEYLSDDFLKKRIKEQEDYMEKVHKSDLPDLRKEELIKQAYIMQTWFNHYLFGKALAVKIDKMTISDKIFKS